MIQACEEAIQLRHDLQQCSDEKDQQIHGLSLQFNAMRGDMLRIDGDIQHLTKSVDKVNDSLKVIADNTTQLTEMISLYNNFKGFGFVVKNLGVIVIGTAALLTAVIFLSDMKITLGA
jgi:hypothetical protein